MKKMVILFAMFASTLALAETETWYGYCLVEKSDTRICTTPELKTDDFKAKCKAFAEDLGVLSYAMKYGTDLSDLEATLSENCDEVRGPDHGAIFACKYAVLCPHSQPHVKHLASRVYATDKKNALNRCSAQNTTTIHTELKKQSLHDCYLKLVVEKMN